MSDTSKSTPSAAASAPAPATRAAAPGAMVLAVTSGKGGVGKTFVSANLAAALTKRGYRVLVLDADLGLANLDVVLNLFPKTTLHDVFTGKAKLENAIHKAPGGFSVLLAGSGMVEYSRLTPQVRNEFLEVINSLVPKYDVMLLDTYNEIFIWVGKGANAEEKKNAMQTAIDYIKLDTSGRTVDNTTMMVLKQGYEPPHFTGHFIAWDSEKWSKGKTYEQIKAELMAGGGSAALLGTSVQDSLSKLTQSTYTFAELTAASLPEGIDATIKEQYLAEAEFKSILGMSKTEFNAMPKWKQSNLKKKVGLF